MKLVHCLAGGFGMSTVMRILQPTKVTAGVEFKIQLIYIVGKVYMLSSTVSSMVLRTIARAEGFKVRKCCVALDLTQGHTTV